MRRFGRDARGATAIEYALLAAIIAISLVTALTSMGDTLSNMINDVADAFDGG